MAITRTPIVDDDGTGTTGTVIDNAWKTELYNQIDGAAPVTKLAGAKGTETAAGPSNLFGFVVPALGVNDSILFTAQTVLSGGAVPVILDLCPVGNGVTVYEELVLTGTTGAGDLLPGSVGLFYVLIQPMPAAGANARFLAYGTFTGGTGQVRGVAPFGRLSTVNLVTPIGSGNTIFFRQMSGLAAGVSLAWSGTAYLLKG